MEVGAGVGVGVGVGFGVGVGVLYEINFNNNMTVIEDLINAIVLIDLDSVLVFSSYPLLKGAPVACHKRV